MDQQTKNDFDFQNDVIERSMNGPVVVDFYLPACAPCKAMAPMLDQAVIEGRFDLLKLDLQQPQVRPYTIQYNVRKVPRLLMFSNGKVVWDSETIQPFNVMRIVSIAKARAAECQIKEHDSFIVRIIKGIGNFFSK